MDANDDRDSRCAVGIDADGDKIDLLLKEVEGKDVNQLITEGEVTTSSGSGIGAHVLRAVSVQARAVGIMITSATGRAAVVKLRREGLRISSC